MELNVTHSEFPEVSHLASASIKTTSGAFWADLIPGLGHGPGACLPTRQS